MGNLDKDILKILSTACFQKIANNDLIKIAQLNTIISVLISNHIAFDLEYSPGTRRVATEAELTIYINPTTQLTFNITLDGSDPQT